MPFRGRKGKVEQSTLRPARKLRGGRQKKAKLPGNIWRSQSRKEKKGKNSAGMSEFSKKIQDAGAEGICQREKVMTSKKGEN